MNAALPEAYRQDAHDLGPQLEPALLDACRGKLSDIRWFRTTWQRGGAATAYAVAELQDGPRDVVIKMPVGPMEHRVLSGLVDSDAPTPGVAFHGTELGGWDIAWVVIERLPGDPLMKDLGKPTFDCLAEAAAAFSAAASQRWPIPSPKPEWPWESLLHKARESAHVNPIDNAQSWANHVKAVQRVLPKLLDVWERRPMTCWCHGDLHPGNLMRREQGSAWGEPGCILLDFAEAHGGHWVEDAIYIERMFWGRPDLLGGFKPVSGLARARRKAGLNTDDDYTDFADVRRVLMAGVAPAFIAKEGHPAYLRAALDVLDRLLPIVAK